MLGDETCKLKDLKTLIDSTKKLSLSVKEKFPINYFGNENDWIRIKGTKALIAGFDDIDSEKLDIIAQYKDIKYVQFNEKNQIVLNFQCEDDTVEAHSIYDFCDDFLEGFQISKYVNYCLKNNYLDIIESNLGWLLDRNSDKDIKQYRLLRDLDETWGVRGVTSSGYKNYDNSIVLYLSLLALHKYSLDKNKNYYIESSFITDSSLYIFFEQEQPISISDIGDIYLGLAVTNGEIRNWKFKAEVRYRIVNVKKDISLSAIFNNPVFSIVHNMNIATIDKEINKLFKLDELEEKMLLFINNLNLSENLSEDALYFLISDLLENIKDCSDISKKTRDEFKAIEIENMIHGTVTLIDFFGKINMITTDVDEQIFIERIYHKVISDLQNRKNN
jgi:hypothetical protein